MNEPARTMPQCLEVLLLWHIAVSSSDALFPLRFWRVVYASGGTLGRLGLRGFLLSLLAWDSAVFFLPPEEPLAAWDSPMFFLPPDELFRAWDSAVLFLPQDEPLAAWDSAVFLLPPDEPSAA